MSFIMHVAKAMFSECTIWQEALRCRHLVRMYEQRLQEIEEQCFAERQLRDNQLANILNALLLLNQSLCNEQTCIRFQLEEKDRIIRAQQKHLQICCKCASTLDETQTKPQEFSTSCRTDLFLGDNVEDTWYTGASDVEDEPSWHCESDKNPNFLESMNQILLQTINDGGVSPPLEKITPEVKCSTEETKNVVDYYETPVQLPANVYEHPESSCSNIYEQIRSQSVKSMNVYDLIKEPPELPPKPLNLLSKWMNASGSPTDVESEPDYCSISELNLPNSAQLKQAANMRALFDKQPVQVPQMVVKQVPYHKPHVSEVIIPSLSCQETRSKTQSSANVLRSLEKSLAAKVPLRSCNTKRRMTQTKKECHENTAVYDLSQNFEEFKLDDIDYSVDEKDKCNVKHSAERRIDKASFEYFLEYTGLSSKCLLNPK